jgi:hypothetical protein
MYVSKVPYYYLALLLFYFYFYYIFLFRYYYVELIATLHGTFVFIIKTFCFFILFLLSKDYTYKDTYKLLLLSYERNTFQ